MLGAWAIHKGGLGWKLTHVPTGVFVKSYRLKTTAKKARAAVMDLAGGWSDYNAGQLRLERHRVKEAIKGIYDPPVKSRAKKEEDGEQADEE